MPIKNRRSLLSSQAVIQCPFVKVTIGDSYTFGVFSRTPMGIKNESGFYSTYKIKYPNYIQQLRVTKVNGQINQYTLQIIYPITPADDPNFFEKVFSSVSETRKITFTYGDASMPTYVYKEEEAIITNISQSFNFGSNGSASSSITYTITAVSSALMTKSSIFTFNKSGRAKPSDEIKAVFKNKLYGLRDIFTGMNESNLDYLIAGDDKYVDINAKANISPLDYITYLVSCMIPSGSTNNILTNDIYLLTLYDDTNYDRDFADNTVLGGPYFKVKKMPTNVEQADAFEVNLGTNSPVIVRDFQIKNQETYSLFYNYTSELTNDTYVRRLNNNGEWEELYSPMFTSKNNTFKTKPEDKTWFTKMAKYPISATLTVQGLLRPAQLMQYIRLNIYFPGGKKHVNSGLYIITKQVDTIGLSTGYTTQLELTRISN